MKRRIKHHQALDWEYLGSIGGSADPGLSENHLRQNPGLYLPGMNIAILWGYPPLKKTFFTHPIPSRKDCTGPVLAAWLPCTLQSWHPDPLPQTPLRGKEFLSDKSADSAG